MNANRMKYLKIISPCPVLNTPEFEKVFGGEDGRTLALDENGHMRSLECTALPGMIFKLEERASTYICRVSNSFYPGPLFIDIRFTKECKLRRKKKSVKFDQKNILSYLRSLEGTPYCWGSNWRDGIPEMLKFYPPKGEISEALKNKWMMKGIDCSGMLFLDESIPRNTSQLIDFGDALIIENKNAEEIKALLKPLDLIVWKGHVVISLDEEHLIESREKYGCVKIVPTLLRLHEILQERKAANKWKEGTFVVRRIPAFQSGKNHE